MRCSFRGLAIGAASFAASPAHSAVVGSSADGFAVREEVRCPVRLPTPGNGSATSKVLVIPEKTLRLTGGLGLLQVMGATGVES
jgi:hypothetical protein